MRVLMTADAVGGVWNYALALARALAPAGVEVTIATMGPRPDRAQREAAGRLPNVDLFESDFALEWMEDPWTDVERAGEWLLSLERRLKPDVVQVNGWSHAAVPFGAPAILVAHSCVLSWWRAVHGGEAPARYDRYREAARLGVRDAALVVAPTRAMLDCAVAHYGEPRRAVVIRNGRDGRSYRPEAKRPHILSAGRIWDDAKNIAALDDVAGALPWEVRIAGDTRSPDGHCLVPHSARALGRLGEEELAAEMSTAAVYALPARYEPFGLTALEAALSGCALVLGDIPSLRELWNGAALFVPPDDRAALRRALLRLTGDSAFRAELAGAAARRARSFGAGPMAAAYLDAYASLARGAMPARALTVSREADACVS